MTKIHASVRIFTRDLQAWLLIKRAKIRFRRGAHDRAAMAWWFLEVGGGPLVSAAACEDKVSSSAPPPREFGSFGGDQFSITTYGYLLRAGATALWRGIPTTFAAQHSTGLKVSPVTHGDA